CLRGRRGRAAHGHCRRGARTVVELYAAHVRCRPHRRARIDGRRAPRWRAGRRRRGGGRRFFRTLDEQRVCVLAPRLAARTAPAGPVRTPRVSALWGDTPLGGRVLVALVLAALLVAPFLVDDRLIGVLILVLYFAYLGQAWNLLMGYAGQLSLGHALYVGIGAYVSAALWIHFGLGPWLLASRAPLPDCGCRPAELGRNGGISAAA